MATFMYSARDRVGQMVEGSIDAANTIEGMGALRERGLVVTSIKESQARAAAATKKHQKKKKITIDDKVVFSRQMHITMVNAGLPLIEGLSILADNLENGSFAAIIKQIEKDVEGGDTLTEAMAKHHKVLTHPYISLIRAGEAAGMLDQILLQLSSYLEKASSLQRKIKSAMIYPAVIGSVAVAVVALLMKVIPVFADIFEQFDAELPAPTKFMINLSFFCQKYFIAVSIGVIILAFLFKRYIGTKSGRYQFDAALLKMPVLGELFQKVAIAKFTRTFSTLLRSGVNIILSLEIVARSSGNSVVEEAVIRVRNSIKEGESISGPLKQCSVFPPMVVRMIDIGERTGALDDMLVKIADYYEEQVDIAVAGLTSLMEPLIICFLGVVVGGIVISMFLPMFQLGSIVGH
ncbi:MAG: type II secretion system F family protein [Candidatus Omnitrophica bacterium]|nr:type II secretion system F family protein [Candidatus Omnitrophota bacterium]